MILMLLLFLSSFLSLLIGLAVLIVSTNAKWAGGILLAFSIVSLFFGVWIYNAEVGPFLDLIGE